VEIPDKLLATAELETLMFDISKCRACGSEYGGFFDLGSYHYGVCKNCKSTIKILSLDDYNRLDVTYDPGTFTENLRGEDWREHLRVDEYISHLAPIVSKLSERSGSKNSIKLLDIGCGMGGFMLAARELGLEVHGVEPSESHSLIGRTRFGLDIRTAYFSKKDYGDTTYDIVVLWHVIEHIFDQPAFLKDVYSVLRPGGVILIATPNARSTIATLTGTNWSMLRPVDHVGLLSPRAFAYIAPAGCSLKVQTFEYLWEPCISLAGGLRNRIFRFRKRSAAPAAAAGAGPSNSFKDTVSRINSNKLLRSAAILISFPMFLFNKLFSRGSCIMCEVKKPM
jgi:2-polyprenyl-3-methyl-5-hydroxy-6-metoxy-1,4-benzoquinol methylase